MEKINFVHLHNHSENSINDSALKAKDMVKKAKNLGMKAIALTDHGNLMGMDKFLSCADDDINLIAGCEVYVGANIADIDGDYEVDHTAKNNRALMHLVILAKNNDGYKDLCNIVTESNDPKNILVINKKRQYPVTTIANLKQNVHGNNIAMSACVQGVISAQFLHNKRVSAELKNLITEKDYATLATNLQKANAELKEAKKNVKSLEGIELMKLQSRVEMMELTISSMTKEYNEKTVEISKRREKEALLITEDQCYTNGLNMAKKMQEIFGKENFYIELQNHGMDEEAYVAPMLVRIAREIGAGLVATNDIHMLNNSKEDVMGRQIMKFNGFEQWFNADPVDKELYLKTADEMLEALRRVVPVEVAKEAMENTVKIAGMCHVKLEQQYHYPVFDCKDAKQLLRQKAYEGLTTRYQGRPDMDDLMDKTEYELNTICNMGFADYLLIESDFLVFCRKVGHMPYDKINWLEKNCGTMGLDQMVTYVESNMTEPGIGIGPGRGSAAGSIVCYECGITNIDPTEHGLKFERFLNPKRVSMPDIDSDFSFETRTIGIEYVKKLYGNDCVCGISTVATAAPRGSIRLVARALTAKVLKEKNIKKDSEEGENIKKEFLNLADKIAKTIPMDPGTTLTSCMEDLKILFSDDAIAMQLIDLALLIEGSVTNTGTHAAGIIITDKPVKNYIALTYDTENKVYKTQCDMVEAEGIHGLLKFDFLGLRTLSTLTYAARQLYHDKGIYVDFDKIPVEPEVIALIRQKLTNTVFQFSSNFMKQIIDQIKPDTFADLIMINAIGRPGPMQYITPIAQVKAGNVKAEYIVPELESILGPTYGYPVYQEQIMELMQFAGMTLGEADNVRRFMSKKKAEKFMKYKPKFVDGMVARGADRQKAESFWEQLVEFAKYAFNKSHADAYVDVAYKCAWFLYHYPAYWLASSMQYSQYSSHAMEELLGAIQDAKAIGIEILPPDINKSSATYSVEGDKAIRFGITAIKGCGDSLKDIIDKKQVFTSIPDVMWETGFGAGVMSSLAQAGAFDSFADNRKAMQSYIEILAAKKDRIKTKIKTQAQNKLIVSLLESGEATSSNWKEAFESHGLKLNVKNMPSASKKKESIAKYESEINGLLKDFYETKIGTCSEDRRERMKEEKEKLGLYVTEHPIDYYEKPVNNTLLNEIYEGEYTVSGIVTEVIHKKTKAKGTPIIFFKLEDTTGEQKINCWTRETEEFGDLIREDAALAVKIKAKAIYDDIADEYKVESSVIEITTLKEKVSSSEQLINMHFATIDEAANFLNERTQYIDNKNGYFIRVIINNRQVFKSKEKYLNVIAIGH